MSRGTTMRLGGGEGGEKRLYPPRLALSQSLRDGEDARRVRSESSGDTAREPRAAVRLLDAAGAACGAVTRRVCDLGVRYCYYC